MMQVAFLLFPGFQLLDVAGPRAVFSVANEMAGRTLYRCQDVAVEAPMVDGHAGAAMFVSAVDLVPWSEVDTLVVSGGPGAECAAVSERLAPRLRAAHHQVRRLASVCNGAFLLGRAGLLDGRRCTTHWARADCFRLAFPGVDLQPDRIFVEDGGVWTSAGVTAGIDMALAMLAADHGADLAREVAGGLVVYYRRPGGQSQHSSLLQTSERTDRFSGLHIWIRDRLAEPLGVERLAEAAGMSARNFSRVYLKEVGCTPAKTVERIRLDVARSLLSEPGARVSDIAARCGFGSTERMRSAFVRRFGLPPQMLQRSMSRA